MKKRYKYVSGMNFRIWALHVICGNQYGLKDELIAIIGKDLYNNFLSVGYIYEPPQVLPIEYGLKVPDYYKREWVATAFAYERAAIFNLNTRRFYYKLPSTMYRSLRFQMKLTYTHFVYWLQDIWRSIKSLFV